jgi:hypothetical protein
MNGKPKTPEEAQCYSCKEVFNRSFLRILRVGPQRVQLFCPGCFRQYSRWNFGWEKTGTFLKID